MEKNKNMTAVDWFADEILKAAIVFLYNEKNEGKFSLAYDKLLEKANKIHKEQIIDADLNATMRSARGLNANVSVSRVKELAEQCYNETYGKTDSNTGID